MTFETTIPVRYRDLDPMGHVNNAVYSTYFEELRTAFFREEIGIDLADTDTALASLTVDFRAPVEGTGTLRAVLDVVEVGRSSLTLSYELYTDDGLAAEGETTQVALADDRPTPLPETVRTVAERHVAE